MKRHQDSRFFGVQDMNYDETATKQFLSLSLSAIVNRSGLFGLGPAVAAPHVYM